MHWIKWDKITKFYFAIKQTEICWKIVQALFHWYQCLFGFQTIASILLLQRLQMLFPMPVKPLPFFLLLGKHTSPPPTHRHKHTEDIFCIADWNGSLPVVNASERIYFLMFYTNKTPRSLLMSCYTLQLTLSNSSLPPIHKLWDKLVKFVCSLVDCKLHEDTG